MHNTTQHNTTQHNTTQHISLIKIFRYSFFLICFYLPEKIHTQCAGYGFYGNGAIVYGTNMHGQIFTGLSATPGDWTASNDHEVTFQHNSDPIQVKYSALTNIPNYGFVNGAFRYNFTPNTSGVDILNFKFKNNTDPLNGVNVWDLSLISRHIQSIPAFTNPYQMLAADVNASGTITTFDIVQLRKLILGQFTNFGQISSLVDSWRFVPLNRFYNNVAAVDLFTYNPFTVTTLGAPYPYYLNQVSFGTTNSPFTADHLYRASAVAVKMGDVNFEAGQLSCEALTGAADDRMTVNQTRNLKEDNSLIPAGTPVSIRLSSTDISDIASWQAGIRYNSDKLKVTGVFSTVFEQFDENAWSINNDEIRMVWLHDHALLEDVKNGETFVEIQGQTRCDVKADEMLIHFDNEILPFLLFGSQGEVLSIQFDYEILPKAINPKEQIASAFPAPFNDYFTIQIPEIEDNSEVDFQLSGLDGMPIMKEQVVFQNGLATIRPDNISTLPGGIYVATILHKNGQTFQIKIVKK